MPDEDEELSDTVAFERLAANSREEIYVLCLYVSGMTARSTEAVRTLTAFCEEHLKGRYQLEIVDLYKNPELSVQARIFATPTLVKQLPLPIRTLVGTLTDEERVLVGLDLVKKKPQ